MHINTKDYADTGNLFKSTRSLENSKVDAETVQDRQILRIRHLDLFGCCQEYSGQSLHFITIPEKISFAQSMTVDNLYIKN